MTLTEFLLARLAEDEAVATEVKIAGALQPGYAWRTITWFHAANRDHGRRWDPDRVMAECAAKRRIVEQVGYLLARGTEVTSYGQMDHNPGEDILSAMAQSYAAHPDYDPAWSQVALQVP